MNGNTEETKTKPRGRGKMTADEIITDLNWLGPHIQRYEITIPNCYITDDNECDLFAIRKSGYVDEFEVKLSRTDFLADRAKMVRYRDITIEDYKIPYQERMKSQPWVKPKYEAYEQGYMPINYFWFCMPAGIATLDEMPDWAGYLEINKNDRIRLVRSAKLLHKKKMSIEDRYNQIRKLGFRYWKSRPPLRNTPKA